MHFRYDWPDKNVSRETLVKFYATRKPKKQRAFKTRAVVLFASLSLTAPWLECILT